MKTFTALGIKDDFLPALKELGIITPTEIQVKAIPFLLEKGMDFIGQAQTGTGKTAAFGLPILQQIDPSIPHIQALILSPTRELGQQIAKQLFKLTKHLPSRIFIESVYGGAKMDEQIAALKRPTHIVVATPGRLVDLLEKKAIHLSHIKTLVLDEADEMLSMGFKKELDHILEYTAGKRNTWLFSATIPSDIQHIIDNYMAPDAMRIAVSKLDIINRQIEHKFILCEPHQKSEVLFQFLKAQGNQRGVVFCKTKSDAQAIAQQLIAKNYNAEALHGDLFQKDRDKVMRAFKNKKLQLLVATDLAARGIDVDELAYVIHYQLPEQTAYYTHRSGRTARAGKKGFSICLVFASELPQLKSIEKELGIAIKNIHK